MNQHTASSRVACQLLSPDNCVVILIDHQPQIWAAVHCPEFNYVIGNAVQLAHTVQVFKLPVVLTSMATEHLSEPLAQAILDTIPGHHVIQRTFINCWQDELFLSSLETIGRRKLVMAGLWTEGALCMSALCALEEGYDVYAVSDASAGTSLAAHQAAMQRMRQAGVIPVTTVQIMLELQRDWARTATAEVVARAAGLM